MQTRPSLVFSEGAGDYSVAAVEEWQDHGNCHGLKNSSGWIDTR